MAVFSLYVVPVAFAHFLLGLGTLCSPNVPPCPRSFLIKCCSQGAQLWPSHSDAPSPNICSLVSHRCLQVSLPQEIPTFPPWFLSPHVWSISETCKPYFRGCSFLPVPQVPALPFWTATLVSPLALSGCQDPRLLQKPSLITPHPPDCSPCLPCILSCFWLSALNALHCTQQAM